jgi:hypothetical protein
MIKEKKNSLAKQSIHSNLVFFKYQAFLLLKTPIENK